MSITEELIEAAQASLNAVESYRLSQYEASDKIKFAELSLANAQARALLAIAQELKRMNDTKTYEFHDSH